MNRILTAAVLLAPLACATPKVASSDVLGPELTVHTLPEGAEVIRNNTVIGRAPMNIPLKPADTTIELSSQRGGYLPSQVVVDAAGARQAGGGETWIVLKPESMGTDTVLDGSKPADLDRAGNALAKANRCDDAQQFFARALTIDPGYAKAHKGRAKCFMQAKQPDAAATELERYLLAAPDAPDAAQVQEQVSRLRGRRDIDLSPSSGSKGGR